MLVPKAALALISSLIVLALGSTGQAQAEAWLAVRNACSSQGVADRLMARLNEAMVAGRARDLQASVAIARDGGSYHVVVRVRRGASLVGVKRLVAGSCEDAEDAALAVLALALSDPSAGEGAVVSEPVVAEPVVAEHVVAEPVVAGQVAAEMKLSPASEAAAAQHSARERTTGASEQRRAGVTGARPDGTLGMSLRAGVDAGTLPVRTAYLGAGVSRFVGPLALRGLLGVGLPYIELQQSDPGSSERLRGDFAMLDLGLCYVLGTRFSFAACTAGDLSVVRSQRLLRVENEPDRTATRTEPRLSGVLTAIVGYPMGAIQPELELSAIAVAFGELQGASRLAFRAGAGVGMHF
jgi:hypothetical protein